MPLLICQLYIGERFKRHGTLYILLNRIELPDRETGYVVQNLKTGKQSIYYSHTGVERDSMYSTHEIDDAYYGDSNSNDGDLCWCTIC